MSGIRIVRSPRDRVSLQIEFSDGVRSAPFQTPTQACNVLVVAVAMGRIATNEYQEYKRECFEKLKEPLHLS